jgi:decaprenylphospho-beta-D-ribofuranose 2-oxidase
MKLAGWGLYPVLEAQLYMPRSVKSLQQMVMSEPKMIARGNGRSYGDSAINSEATVDTRYLNRIIAFDPTSGQLIAEAGVQLGDIINAFLPRGWFLMVSPGTKFVTLGGAIAADVHGKNHHLDGSFRTCVDWIDVVGPDGEIRRCSPQNDSNLFDYTLGGMGLTGIVIRAAIRLRSVESAWIRQTTIATPNLNTALAAFEARQDATYSVAWIDCFATGNNLGRSLVMLGEHAVPTDLSMGQAQAPLRSNLKRKLSIPFNFPRIALNRLTVRSFNALYYLIGTTKTGTQLVDWDSYFYPLDAINGWNRIYGRKGFAQFQCALPLDRSKVGLTALLSEISKVGSGSFFAVLKRLGKQESAFSFPMEGYTLALDFPITPKNLILLERLDQITITHGGRFYLAKDSRMTSATLRASDTRLLDFQTYRDTQGFTDRFSSAQSKRLSL